MITTGAILGFGLGMLIGGLIMFWLWDLLAPPVTPRPDERPRAKHPKYKNHRRDE